MNNGDSLTHYGVKGMQWGKRKKSYYSSRRSTRSNSGSNNSEEYVYDSEGRPYKKAKHPYLGYIYGTVNGKPKVFQSRRNVQKNGYAFDNNGNLYIKAVTAKGIGLYKKGSGLGTGPVSGGKTAGGAKAAAKAKKESDFKKKQEEMMAQAKKEQEEAKKKQQEMMAQAKKKQEEMMAKAKKEQEAIIAAEKKRAENIKKVKNTNKNLNKVSASLKKSFVKNKKSSIIGKTKRTIVENTSKGAYALYNNKRILSGISSTNKKAIIKGRKIVNNFARTIARKSLKGSLASMGRRIGG